MNRLPEFTDNVCIAQSKFAEMVASGIPPEYAFHLITEKELI